MFCQSSLTTYCMVVMQGHSGKVVAGNYLVKYILAAAGTAVVLPAIESIGSGAFFTVFESFLVDDNNGDLHCDLVG